MLPKDQRQLRSRKRRIKRGELERERRRRYLNSKHLGSVKNRRRPQKPKRVPVSQEPLTLRQWVIKIIVRIIRRIGIWRIVKQKEKSLAA